MRKTKCNVLRMILCILLLLGTTVLHAQDKPNETYNGDKDKLHIYLLIGQSNMAGRAPFSKKESDPIERCFLLDKEGKWESAKNPLNRYSTIRKDLGMQKMNPGYSFSKLMLEKDKGISLGLVVNAKGGSSIKLWEKGSNFYNEALRRVRIAQNTGELKGVLWHQGEADAKDTQYLEKLKSLIENIRKDLNEPNLPFIAGQINNVPIINEQIAKLPETVPFTGFASSEDLRAMDLWHFDTKSMILLGQRYAEAMLKVQTKLKAEQKNEPAK